MIHRAQSIVTEVFAIKSSVLQKDVEYHRLDPVSLRPLLGEWMKGLACRLRGNMRMVLCVDGGL